VVNEGQALRAKALELFDRPFGGAREERGVRVTMSPVSVIFMI
jgi:hypothetical protein